MTPTWQHLTPYCRELHAPPSGACVYCAPFMFPETGHDVERRRIGRGRYETRLQALALRRAG